MAAPFAGGNGLTGVVAADITLDSFSAYLGSHRISEGSISYLLDQNGMVLAASDGSEVARSDNNKVDLHHISCGRARGWRLLPTVSGPGATPRRSMHSATTGATTSPASPTSTRASASDGSCSS